MVIVDGFNVLGARPDGWWRDRAAAMARLCDAIAGWRPPSTAVTVVVDGWPSRELPEGDHDGVGVRYARRRGPDGADRVIVGMVRDAADPTVITVVTSDRRLRDDVGAAGVTLVGAGRFRAALDSATGAAPA